MTQVQVSIGRNTSPGVPMTYGSWQSFQGYVSDALWARTRGGYRWIEIHAGEGFWDDQVEESVHVTMLDVFWLDRASLTRDLASIAKRYGQNAIALSITEPELIAAG